MAFSLRVLAFLVWTLAQTNFAFLDCEKGSPRLNWVSEYIQSNVCSPNHHSGIQEILCKAILWLVVYGQMASVFWMSVEGGYLISRFTIFAMRNSEGPMAVYLLVGWGAPLIPVITWSILHDQQLPDKSFCWIPYSNSPHMWILTAAIGAALIVRVYSSLLICKHPICPVEHALSWLDHGNTRAQVVGGECGRIEESLVCVGMGC
jgi:hypothetical protein